MSGHGMQMQRQTAYNVLKNIYSRVGLSVSGCHILRHSFAMELMHKDVNLGIIQKALRHKRINTTMIYADASPDMIKDALKK